MDKSTKALLRVNRHLGEVAAFFWVVAMGMIILALVAGFISIANEDGGHYALSDQNALAARWLLGHSVYPAIAALVAWVTSFIPKAILYRRKYNKRKA